MPKNPDRPKIKYKRVKKPPPAPKTPDEIAAEYLAKTEARHAITPQKVCTAIARANGLLTEVSRYLRVPRGVLQRYIDKNEVCAEALAHARDTVGDLAESKLIEKIEEGDLRAIIFYLSTVHAQTRGYRLSGNAAAAATSEPGRGPVFVETINIVGVPSGTFLPKEAVAPTDLVIDN